LLKPVTPARARRGSRFVFLSILSILSKHCSNCAILVESDNHPILDLHGVEAFTSAVLTRRHYFFLAFFFDIPAELKAIAIACLRFLTTGAFLGPFGSLPEWRVPLLNSRITLATLAFLAAFFISSLQSSLAVTSSLVGCIPYQE
jgi:hypothetical protein